MRKGYKVFLISFILSLPFWLGINIFSKNLEDFLFWQEISRHPEIFTANINEQILKEEIERLRIEKLQKSLEDLKIDAKAVISVFINNQGEEKILFKKNIDPKLPIASLTKLMTALVVLENYDLSKEIKISEEAVSQEEDFGKLEAGKNFQVRYLLYPLLMESSNDAAFSLANDYDGMTEEKFVELMNLKAQKMNLKNTFFINSTGLDYEEPETEINPPLSLGKREVNYSTVIDLVKFIKELLKKPLIWEILSTPEYNLYGPKLINTNEFLKESVSWQNRIIGGKTGYTDRAGECFLLVLRDSENRGYFINVILGSDDRFKEMRKIIEAVE